MKAIITKYVGPTDTKGARITARCDAGSISISYPHELSGSHVHAAAAMALVRKLGWVPTGPDGKHQNGHVGSWVAGYNDKTKGYTFCFAFGVSANPQWDMFDYTYEGKTE